jgi:hypothetical protein
VSIYSLPLWRNRGNGTYQDAIADALPHQPLGYPTYRRSRSELVVSKVQNAIVTAAVSVLFLLGIACIILGPIYLAKHGL